MVMTFLRIVRFGFFAFALAPLVVHCASPENQSTYTPADQDRAVARVTGRFVSGDGATILDLCEAPTSAPLVSSCSDSYVAHSGGRGERISDGVQSGVGCGGCPLDGVVVPLVVALEEGGSRRPLDGIADLGSDDGLPLTRAATLSLSDGGEVGTIGVDGIVTLTGKNGAPATKLVRSGDGRCDAVAPAPSVTTSATPSSRATP